MLCRDPDKSHKMCIGGCNERCQRIGKIMNNCNWTAGPWVVVNGADVFTETGATNNKGITADSDDGWLIADCMSGFTFVDGEEVMLESQEANANANLIASAPELYAALEMVKQAHIMDICGGFLNSDELNQVSEALAKARGETE